VRGPALHNLTKASTQRGAFRLVHQSHLQRCFVYSRHGQDRRLHQTPYLFLPRPRCNRHRKDHTSSMSPDPYSPHHAGLSQREAELRIDHRSDCLLELCLIGCHGTFLAWEHEDGRRVRGDDRV